MLAKERELAGGWFDGISPLRILVVCAGSRARAWARRGASEHMSDHVGRGFRRARDEIGDYCRGLLASCLLPQGGGWFLVFGWRCS